MYVYVDMHHNNKMDVDVNMDVDVERCGYECVYGCGC